MTIIQIIIFVIVSILLVIVLWRSIQSIKFHGFYRFFAFEAVLILVIINVPYWFHNPFSFFQIVSWTFLCLSLVAAYEGFYLLWRKGGSKRRDFNSANFEFEDTVNLVTTGLYKYIRHPLYCSIILAAIGAFLKNVSVYGIILLVIVIIFVTATAKTEEKENIKFFGNAYLEYMKKTKSFIPFIY